MTYSLIVALLVALGTGLVAAATGWPRDRLHGTLVAGTGLFVGLLAGALLAGLLMPAETARLPLRVAIAAFLLATASWSFAFLRRPALAAPLPPAAPSARARLAWWVLLALVVLHLVPLVCEVWLRPAYPWDAWATWLIKPRAWFLSGRFASYVDPSAWLATEGTRTMVGWNYPELSAWLQLLLAQARGAWEEPLLLLPWLALLLALLTGVYAVSRRLGAGPLPALLAVYGLVSMPLIDSHIALAGYLDLWVATAVVFSLAFWLCWLHAPERRGYLVLAAGFALCLPLLKREGVVWMVLLVALMLYARGGIRWRRRMLGLALAGLVAGLVLVLGFNETVNGWLVASGLAASSHVAEPVRLGWRPGGLAIVAASFGADNWHLLFLAALLALLLRWRSLREDPQARLVGLFLASGWIFLLLLFCLTPASSWAQSQTAAHRLVMHLVPATVLWLVLMLRDSPNPSRTAAGTAGVR